MPGIQVEDGEAEHRVSEVFCTRRLLGITGRLWEFIEMHIQPRRLRRELWLYLGRW
jgi:hypothetical protein